MGLILTHRRKKKRFLITTPNKCMKKNSTTIACAKTFPSTETKCQQSNYKTNTDQRKWIDQPPRDLRFALCFVWFGAYLFSVRVHHIRCSSGHKTAMHVISLLNIFFFLKHEQRSRLKKIYCAKYHFIFHNHSTCDRRSNDMESP